MFIDPSQLKIPVDEATKTLLINEVEGEICALLPLEEKVRLLSRYPDEVYLTRGRLKIRTYLLNITQVKQAGEVLEFMAIGNGCQELFFGGKALFEPLLELEVKSWYTADTLPWDIKGLMLEMIEEKYTLQTSEKLQEKSIKMWPREVEYAVDTAFKQRALKAEELKKKYEEVLARYRW